MAGKHYNFDQNGQTAAVTAAALAAPPLFPGSRIDKALAEGRAVGCGEASGSNPHPSGTPENGAWSTAFLQGFSSASATADLQFQTSSVDRV